MFHIRWRSFKAGATAECRTLKEALDVAMSIEGQMSVNEIRVLIELAKTLSANETIVEIGTYRGRSAIALALGAKLGNRNTVYAVDPHVAFRGVRGGGRVRHPLHPRGLPTLPDRIGPLPRLRVG